jgi:hypothetical protein
LRSTLIGSCTATDLENARKLAAKLVTEAMRQDLDREALAVRQALKLRHLRSGKILMLLINRAGTLCSASDISKALETVSSGTIKVYMSELRNALARVGLTSLIQTEWRKGYWISREDADEFCAWLDDISYKGPGRQPSPPVKN